MRTVHAHLLDRLTYDALGSVDDVGAHDVDTLNAMARALQRGGGDLLCAVDAVLHAGQQPVAEVVEDGRRTSMRAINGVEGTRRESDILRPRSSGVHISSLRLGAAAAKAQRREEGMTEP